MAEGHLINRYSNADSDILSVQSTLDKTYFGKIDSITLTEFDSSTVPAIAAGSVVENNGALYSFASETAISTTDPGTSSTVADGTVYVCLVPQAGTASGATTDATGYATTSTVITLASAGTGSILAGDYVQFTGDTAKYLVTSGDADVSGGGSITIASPGLTTAIPASATAITIYAGSLTAAFTATAPVWSDSKQGWYGDGSPISANYRYVARCLKATASYTEKYIMSGYYEYVENLKSSDCDIVDVDISGDVVLADDFQQFDKIKVFTGTLDASGEAFFDSGLSNLEDYIVLDVSWYQPGTPGGIWQSPGSILTSGIIGDIFARLYDSSLSANDNYIYIKGGSTTYSKNYRIVLMKVFS